ncbi:MAG: DsbC family protein [Porticoccaceae bacterium]
MLKIIVKRLIARCVACVIAICVGSIAAADVSGPVADKIIQSLSSGRSDLNYSVLGKSPIAGFYEVQVEGGPLLYVSADGEYFFDGSLYQVKAGQFVDVLDIRLSKARRDLFADRSTSDMIIFKPVGETKAVMNVFTDVDCGYCRKLHAEMGELNSYGIEVRYLAFPRSGIPSESYDKIATAWCAQNQSDTLTRIKNGEDFPTSVCADNPVADHLALGRKIGVSGTPAIILMDGSLIPGYQSAADFAKLFSLK